MAMIARQVRRTGLDDRFMMFVVVTMIASVSVSSVAAAAFAALKEGEPLGVLFIGIIGAGAVFGPMLVIGLVPSMIAFSLVWRLVGGERSLPRSAEYAGLATAVVASVFWIALLTWLNGEGAELVVGAVGVAAIALAPLIARWAYRPSVQTGTMA